jgi:polyisoprenoid-binding protein YceI
MKYFSLVTGIILAISLPALGINNPFLKLEGDWELKTGYLRYYVTHPMHNADGRSDQVRVTMSCSTGKCKIALSVPSHSFTSKDVDRDLELKKVIASEKFKEIKFVGVGQPKGETLANVEGVVSFHGVDKSISDLNFKVTKGWNEITVEGEFKILLTDFSIERPSLIGIPIGNEVKINTQLVLVKK